METLLQTTEVRWMIRSDLPAVSELSRQGRFMTEEDLTEVLRHRNAIGIVAEQNGAIAGYAVYILNATNVTVEEFQIDLTGKTNGVGEALVEKLKQKLGNKRPRLRFVVPERCLGFQVWLRGQGFRYVRTMRGKSGEDDRYVMLFSVRGDEFP